MPVTKSAKKKLRKDKKREKENLKIKNGLKRLMRDAKKNPSPKKIQEAFSLIDKAAKNNIIHKNNASRLKSGLSKLISKGVKKVKDEVKAPKKNSPKKAKKTKK